MNTLPGIILASFHLTEMLGGVEISAKLLDEEFESGRIQQEAHGVCVGFELLVRDGEHGGVSCESLFGVKAEVGNLGKQVFSCVYSVFRRGLNTVEISI